ncbi:hypothetical protein G6O67_005677 [Ophiocordyceps sinensis]|uniref:DNA polymerase delta subunit 3 n=1 Tax=Ophiocordyceps sinensis TaxID=72228 RepID=A0A8H4LXR0_9HYPO|nr:hypothetical protein G6O67_005677 [Ophiocordyceps sinensis]
MDEHKKFLADRLLSEERPITYRLLSRALDVHVNTAKRMLYDFHQYQNSLRAGSIRATYLLYGVKSAKRDDENGMSSSIPEPEPRSEPISTQTLALVHEENLEAILRDFAEVTSIHIYSLAPWPRIDVASLADVASSVSETCKQDGPWIATSKHGVIPNPSVRRRDPAGRRAPAAVSAPKPGKQEKVSQKPAPAAKVKQETVEKSSSSAAPSGKGAAAKRGGPGGIMQSFAKAASRPPPKPKQASKKEETGEAAMSDDGEADDSDMPSSKKTCTTAPDTTRVGKKEREEYLRRMMDEDDGGENDGKDDDPDDEMDDVPEPEPEPEQVEPETKPKDEPAEVMSSSGKGRRRGKRRVMKKKRILDDQGYMVTIQESGWESFSEDDTPQPPTKKATPAPTPSSSGAKAKKSAGKKDQGNIASFFSKK